MLYYALPIDKIEKPQFIKIKGKKIGVQCTPKNYNYLIETVTC